MPLIIQVRLIKKFLQLEASSGIVLLLTALFSLVWANSRYAHLQDQFIHASLFYINEGLMTFFFFLVGLELKRGYLEGQFNRFSQISLSGFAALFGMLTPALIYYLLNYKDPYLLQGWAIPVATDIAFAMAILSLFGNKIPFALKLFLLSLAIFDDLGALIIIVIFHSHDISYIGIVQIFALIGLIWLLNLLKIRALIPYLIVGVFLWFAALQTGIHPTITGFIVATLLPAHGKAGAKRLTEIETWLHPWVSFLILPLFALANAGLSFETIPWNFYTNTLVIGIVAGLFLGKQLGVMTSVWLLIKLKWASLPERTDWMMLYGVAILCGIGFTMSLFLGTLSFQNNFIYIAEVRLGVIIGSVLSGLTGAIVLFIALAKNKHHRSKVVE